MKRIVIKVEVFYENIRIYPSLVIISIKIIAA